MIITRPRPQTLAACLATIAIAVPAGWRTLDADIQADGPSLRPAASTLELDDAVVSVQLDRGALVTGGTLSAILVATSDRPHAVTVDMTTLQDMGMGGERVPNPPVEVDRRRVVLEAQPGGGPPVVASVTLGSRRDPSGFAVWYDVYVTRHGVASHGPDTAAQAGIVTWSGNTFPVTIEPPVAIPAEGPFTIAVRIKNTTKQPLADLDGAFGGRLSWNELDNEPQLGTDDYDVEPIADKADDANDPLAAGAERLLIYRVTPKRTGISHFTFVAHVRANGGRDGAMEIASFDRDRDRSAPNAESAPRSLAVR